MEPVAPPPEGGPATRAVHAARAPAPVQQPIAPPIHPAAAWAVDRSADLGALLTDELEGYVYGRYDNPTNTALHAQVAALHDAEAAWSFASGTAAIFAAIETLRGSGRVLAGAHLYGGTHALLVRLQARAGWQVDRLDLGDPRALDRVADGQHTVCYVETIANPTLRVADLPALATRCRERGMALVVDNTFASPVLCRPLTHGATLVVESATKYLGGHGDVVAGVLAGPRDLVAAAREIAYEVGASLGPFEAWLVARGIQTLPLRMERACANAAALAEDLAASAAVVSVRYPTGPLVDRLLGGRAGAVLAVDLGDRATAEAFADSLRVFSRATSLGATHSLVLHPATTSHRQLDAAALAAAGIPPGLIRLAVGIEDLDDLRADIARALTAITRENAS